MYTGLWGSSTWDTLMFMALNLGAKPSVEKQERFRQFLILFFEFLPCQGCQTHASNYYHSDPTKFDTSNNENLFRDIVAFKNMVNQRTNKPTMTTKEARHALFERHGGLKIKDLKEVDARDKQNLARIKGLQSRVQQLRDVLDDDNMLIQGNNNDTENLMGDAPKNEPNFMWIINVIITSIMLVLLVAIVILLSKRSSSSAVS
jgi:hypothetical protein